MKLPILIAAVLATGGPTPSPGVQRVTGRAPIYSDGGLTPQIGIAGLSSSSRCPAGQALTVDGGAIFCHSALAGGLTTQVQWNNGGALAGLVNAYTTDGVTLIIGADAGTVAGPDAGFRFFGRQYTSWTEVTAKGPNALEYPLQPALYAGQYTLWSPSGTTSISSFGSGSAGVATVSGTTTTPTPAVGGDDWVYRWRWRHATSGSAGTSAYAQQTGGGSGLGALSMGDAANRGGFYFYADCNAAPAVAAGARALVGITNPQNTLPNANPSAQTDCAYFGFDTTGTTWNFCTNSATGAATCIDLGADFTVRDAGTGYSFRIYAQPNATSVDYHATNDSTGAVKFGTVLSDVPTNITTLQPWVWVNNGATAAITYMECSKVYWRSDH